MARAYWDFRDQLSTDEQNSEKSAGDANKNLKKLTKEDIAELSEWLGENWKKLATELN